MLTLMLGLPRAVAQARLATARLLERRRTRRRNPLTGQQEGN